MTWNRTFLKVDSMVIYWWIVTFLHCANALINAKMVQMVADAKPHVSLSAQCSISHWFKSNPSQDNILNRV